MSFPHAIGLMEEIIQAVKEHVDERESRIALYESLIYIFESYDAPDFSELGEDDEEFKLALIEAGEIEEDDEEEEDQYFVDLDD